MSRGTDWYVSHPRGGHTSVLQRLRHRDARAFLVRTDSFAMDTAALWEWLCVPPPTRPALYHGSPPIAATTRRADAALSDEGRRALAHHTRRERAALDALEQLAENGNYRRRRTRRSRREYDRDERRTSSLTHSLTPASS